jgi:cation diffusion facilitator CzcD-associated flavoprotein CzcO
MADRKFRVVVAGAGVSGLFMAETLKRAGIDFTIYEKAGEVGGTWRDNTFPGLFVDVLSRQYEFPFQPNYNWSRKYAPATEIWAYIKRVARDRGLTKFIRFNEEIVAARFTDGRWQIETAKGNTDFADVLICATGFLHSRSFLTLRAARVSPARLFTRRAGIITCPMPASTGALSAAAPVACRSPRRSPGRAAR